MRAVIVGAGIGGLAAAVALGLRGVRCVIVERQRSVPAGAGGIQISPNGVVALRTLGVAGALSGAMRPLARELRSWRDGAVISRIPLGHAVTQRYGAPYWALPRGLLCRALLAHAVRVQGAGAIRLGRTCAGIEEGPAGVEVALADGTRVTGDFVVAADGLRSAARHGPPRYSGHVAYRAVLRRAMAPRVVVWLGPGQHCVTYPLSPTVVNVVATLPSFAPPTAVRQLSPETVLMAYANWHPQVFSLLAGVSGFDRHPLYDREPSWGRGRMALVGDAAHPMLPFVAQGACLALEDAVALADAVAEDWSKTVPEGLGLYAAVRRERVAGVSERSRAGAIEYHLSDGPEQRARDRRLAGLDLSAFDQLYGYRGTWGRPLSDDPTYSSL